MSAHLDRILFTYLLVNDILHMDLDLDFSFHGKEERSDKAQVGARKGAASRRHKLLQSQGKQAAAEKKGKDNAIKIDNGNHPCNHFHFVCTMRVKSRKLHHSVSAAAAYRKWMWSS